MAMIPKNLSELDHFRSDPRVQFKEEVVDGVKVITPCYMIATVDFWKTSFATELRGHVFRADDGQLISAALEKFFNVNENAWTQMHDLPWDEIQNVADKRDGSMITFAIINDKVFAKTKKSFYSDVAILAQKFIDENEDLKKYIYMMLDELDASPVYEFWHPDWQIVLNYGDKPSMTYLGYRDMEDGKWVPANDLPAIGDVSTILDNIEAWQQTAEDVEGIVVQFNDGRVVKLKTSWYLQQHHVSTDMRERDIAELAALEKIDDVKSLVVESGMDISLIEEIEQRVAKIIVDIRNNVEACVGGGIVNQLTTKEMALHFNNHPYFRLIMQQFRGQEPSYVQYFLQNHLKQEFGLKCVYNSKF